MIYNRRVVGYHGCDASVADLILAGGAFLASENTYDWLGRGIYFWEYGLERAWEWAHASRERGGRVKTPAVVGALIQLGNCFDLMDTRATAQLAAFADAFIAGLRAEALPVPQNHGGSDRRYRDLDCAVINALLPPPGPDYQTVRCGFVEGGPVYDDGAGTAMEIRCKSHVQIAVRDPACVIGVFRPRPLQGGSAP